MVRLRLLVALLPVVSTAAVSDLSAQRVGNDLSLRFGARIVALHEDSRAASDSWTPGAELIARFPLVGILTGEVSMSTTRTQRWREFPCPDEVGFPCPPGGEVSGWTGTMAGLAEANLVLDSYTAYSGVGYGRKWDSQLTGVLEYGGPLWIWTVGVERRVGRSLGVDLSYKFLRMTWSNDYHNVLQGIHMTHHQLALGITLAPWSQE